MKRSAMQLSTSTIIKKMTVMLLAYNTWQWFGSWLKDINFADPICDHILESLPFWHIGQSDVISISPRKKKLLV